MGETEMLCTLLRTLLVSVLGLYATNVAAQAVLSDFSGFVARGDAVVDGESLTLTTSTWQSGTAFLAQPIALGAPGSFSTSFSFEITDPSGSSDSDGQGADGITFTVHRQSSAAGGGGGGLGYEGIAPSVAVEFDTWDNGRTDRDNGNHVGINVDGSLDSVAFHPAAGRFNDGAVWYAWIEYDGATRVLEVRYASSNDRPQAAALAYQIDLAEKLTGGPVLVGFTSGTGAAGGRHRILAWRFVDSYASSSFVAAGGIRGLPGLQSITVYEQTYVRTANTYAPNAPQLMTRLPNPLSATNNDFFFFPDEFYDVFYSDGDGTPNPDGAFVTIEGVWRNQAERSGSMNINEVELTFAAGRSDFGDFVSSHVLGSLCDPTLGNQCTPGSEALAVDQNLATFPRFGHTSQVALNERFRLTIGFDGISPVPPAPPPPAPLVQLHEIRNSSRDLVQAFGGEGPHRATLRTAQDETEFPPHYGLSFFVNDQSGSGTVVSSDPDVVRVVKAGFATADADAQGLVRRRIVVGKSGSATLTITYASSAPGVAAFTTTVDITVTSVDLGIVDVPEFAEEDVGGLVRAGNLVQLHLSYPTGQSLGLLGDPQPDPLGFFRAQLAALQGGANIRLWRDSAKTQPIPLPATFDGATGPRRVFVEVIAASNTVRDIELRLSATSGLHVLGIDTIRLTGVDLAIEAAAPVIGQNDDDDDSDNQKDVEQATGPTAGEDDMSPVTVRLRPFVRSYGRVRLGLTPGLSLWRSFNKQPQSLLFDGLAQRGGTIELAEPEEWNRRYFVEGLGPAASPQTISLSITPELLVHRTPVIVGPPLSVTAIVQVIKADLDIAGVPDFGDDEFNIGGQVPQSTDDEDPPSADALTALHLKLAPGSYRPDSLRLAVGRGAAKVRLWAPPNEADGEAPLTKLALEQVPDEGWAIQLRPDELPKTIYVQGVEATEPREVEIELTAFDSAAVTGRVHRDRVRLTVVGKAKTGDELVLEPGIIVALTSLEGHDKDASLNVLLKNASGDVVADVAADADTTYQWIDNGLVEAAEAVSGTDLPIATLEMNQRGVLSVKSRGVQFLRAKRGDLVSNVAIVLAGVRLKSIDLVGESKLTSAAKVTWKNAPLILTSESILPGDKEQVWANWPIGNEGDIVLEDVEFELLDGISSFKLSDITGILSKIRRPPVVKLLEKGLWFGVQRLIEFEAADEKIVGLASGAVTARAGGITGVTGTLTIDKLGSADDTVTVIVLPTIERVEIRAEDDPPGDHTAPLELQQGGKAAGRWISAYAEGKPIVRAEVPLSKKIPGWMVPGSFDIVVPLPTGSGQTEIRMRGELEVLENESGARSALFKDVVLGFSAQHSMVTWSTTQKKGTLPKTHVPIAYVDKNREERKSLFFVKLAAGDRPGRTRVMAMVEWPGLGRQSGSRMVHVVAEVGCEAVVVQHFGKGLNKNLKEDIAELDAAFTPADALDPEERLLGVSENPFRAALLALNVKEIAGLDRVGPSALSSGSLSTQDPLTAGWLYFVEVPVNDPSACELDVRTSIAVDEGESMRTLPLVFRTGRSELGYSIARYADPKGIYQYALVYAQFRGWVAVTGKERRVDRVWERLSVFDVPTDVFRASNNYAFQMVLDSTGDGGPLFRTHHLSSGSGDGKVAPIFKPGPLDAAKIFRPAKPADQQQDGQQ